MTTEASVGESTLEDARAAGRAATEAARAGLTGGEPDLCLVFATSGYDQEALLRGVSEVAGDAALTGCSGEGVIGPGTSLECDHAVSVLALRSDGLTFVPYHVGGYGDAPVEAGAALGRAVSGDAGDDAVGLLVFPDGLVGDCTAFLSALRDGLSVPMLVAGGSAADNFGHRRTWQYHGRTASSGGVSALLIRGRGRLEVAVSHGCRPIGLPRRVTSADGGWMRTIDDRPAWSVFKEYLDGDPEDLNAEGIVHLCVGLPLGDDDESYIIRTPLGLDQDTGALFFPGGGVDGPRRIRLTRRDPVQIRESAISCARSIQERCAGRAPAAVFQFDCAGRGKVLFGSRAADEIVTPLQETLGRSTPWIGFHTYGEIAPLDGELPRYHNYTVVLCALFDDE